MKLVFKALPTSLAGFAFFLSCTTSSSTLALPDNDVRGLTQQQEKTSAAVVATSTIASSHPMPPNPEPYQITSLDGTTTTPWMQIIVRGEITSFHEIYEETLDGFTVKPVKGGMYKYLDVDDATGELIETRLVVGKDDPVEAQLRKDAAKTSQDIKEKMKKKQLSSLNNEQEGKNDTGTRRLRGESNVDVEQHRRRTAITSGLLKNLVIPFKFSDHTSKSLPSQAQLNTLMNNVGPDPSVCPTGSVRDVYLTNSFNQLDVQSTVIDWVTLDPTYTEAYCANGESGLSERIHLCLVNALNKAVAAGVDFGTFDLNNDGLIDGMTFFHSGYAAEFGGTDAYGTGSSGRIWSHKWQIHTQNWSSSGVRVYEYHINPALWSRTGSAIGRIGVVAHETGHFLGLPDLYDYGAGSGIGSYGLMANSWGFDYSQYYPPLMSAWGKLELGWVTPRNIRNSGSYSLNQACDSADMIIINVGYPSGEYLLIENRQACGTELVLPQGGLAIWHIDENANNRRGYNGQTGWPTNGNHYNVALLQADGNYGLEKNWNRGDRYDLFHSGCVDAIGPNGISSGQQHPNTNAYQNGDIFDTHVTISNISAAGATMTFDISTDEFSSFRTAPIPNTCNEYPEDLSFSYEYPEDLSFSYEYPEDLSFSYEYREDLSFSYEYREDLSFSYDYPTMAPVPVSSSPSVESPYCPSSILAERTFYATGPAAAPFCFKIELFPGGRLIADTDDPTCSEEVFTESATYSTFQGFFGNQALFGALGDAMSGSFQFVESDDVTKPALVVNDFDGVTSVFDVEIKVPTCSFPYCPSSDIEDTIIYAHGPAVDACFKMELYPGGGLIADTTDPTCSNPKEDFTESVTFSTFQGFSGNQAIWGAAAPGGFSGTFEFLESDDITKPALVLNGFDGVSSVFDVGIELSTCSSPYCPKSEIEGRTIKVIGPAPDRFCLKMELYLGGRLIIDTTNQDCQNNEFTESVTLSTFEGFNGRQVVWWGSPGSLSGTFDFVESDEVVGPELVVNGFDSGVFDVEIKLPTCAV